MCKIVLSVSSELPLCVVPEECYHRENGLAYDGRPDFRLGSESGQVEQPVDTLRVRMGSIFLSVKGTGQGHGTEDPEEHWSEGVALLDSASSGCKDLLFILMINYSRISPKK